MIITISGPAASGKGTLARMLAKELALPHYDFGLMFRAIALLAKSYGMEQLYGFINNGELSFCAEQIIFRGIDFNPILRLEEIGLMAARLASSNYELLESVAKSMVKHDGFIGDGRTCSQMYSAAEYKFYITAGEEERMQRRKQDGGETNIFSERETLDYDRLRLDPSSLLVDTSGKCPDESIRELLSYIR